MPLTMPVLGRVLGRVAGRALGALVAAALALTLPACGRDGPSAAPGFDGRTLRLGVLTPLQGPVAVVGRPLTTGGQLYFDWLNDERGGIAGRYRVELVVEDTGYRADTALAKYQKIKGSVVMFEQALGTGIVTVSYTHLTLPTILLV